MCRVVELFCSGPSVDSKSVEYSGELARSYNNSLANVIYAPCQVITLSNVRLLSADYIPADAAAAASLLGLLAALDAPRLPSALAGGRPAGGGLDPGLDDRIALPSGLTEAKVLDYEVFRVNRSNGGWFKICCDVLFDIEVFRTSMCIKLVPPICVLYQALSAFLKSIPLYMSLLSISIQIGGPLNLVAHVNYPEDDGIVQVRFVLLYVQFQHISDRYRVYSDSNILLLDFV